MDVDELFPPKVQAPQKEHVPGNAASLYDKVQVDSEVERHFVRARLASEPPDPSVQLDAHHPPVGVVVADDPVQVDWNLGGNLKKSFTPSA